MALAPAVREESVVALTIAIRARAALTELVPEEPVECAADPTTVTLERAVSTDHVRSSFKRVKNETHSCRNETIKVRNEMVPSSAFELRPFGID
jgi:hypothetical protein